MEFLRYPQVIRQLFNGGRFGPPLPFTAASTCSWIGHPVSGLLQLTRWAVHPRFPCGSILLVLNLARYNNSPDRSTKSTTSHFNVLCVLVNIRFQVLFHSPPGVLFTFPSQYFSSIGHQVVFRLGGWSPRLLTGFLVSADTLDTASLLSRFAYETFTPFGHLFQKCSATLFLALSRSLPRSHFCYGLASSAFARHYSRNLF